MLQLVCACLVAGAISSDRPEAAEENASQDNPEGRRWAVILVGIPGDGAHAALFRKTADAWEKWLIDSLQFMLPPKIAVDICSLIPGQDRLTVSVVFNVHPHTGVVADDDIWIGKSIIKSGGKLTYRDVDAVLAGEKDVKLEGTNVKDIQILQVSHCQLMVSLP
jgi:hypothetical protein